MNSTPDTPTHIAGRYRTGLLLLAACFFMPAPAQAEDLVYDVEVIVFDNQNPGDGGEHWPVSLREDFGEPGYHNNGSLQELSTSSYQLNNIAIGLKQARGYNVLLHTAWRQPARDGRNAIAFPVNVAVGGKRLNGTITLIRERYLHLEIDLVLASADAFSNVSYLEPDSTAVPVYELREKRRIKKSRTVHYFDHPHFGVIATVTPYESPRQLQQALEAEQEAAEQAAEATEPPDSTPLADDDQLTR